MDSFYASVEARDNPTLRGKPIAVGGDAKHRGVVSSASYEARRLGVRSAMPMARAVALCPNLVVLPGNMVKYVQASEKLREILGRFSPLVEPLSLDEAFLDLTGTERLLGSPRDIGVAIRDAIERELSLTASVGISVSKFVAKLASDHEKPNGLTLVPAEEVVAFVQSLPLERLWGVGPATLRALHGLGIRTMKALAECDVAELAPKLGASGARLVALARGEDDRPVIPDSPAKSLSHEVTFGKDESEEGLLEAVLLGLAEKLARRARRMNLAGRTVTLKLRLPDFTTYTRQCTLPIPAHEAREIFEAARSLFSLVPRGGKPVRLVGIGLSGLLDSRQLELFGEPRAEQRRRLEEAEDAIVARFGGSALARARTLLAKPAED
jgi:DNA polymerase-4